MRGLNMKRLADLERAKRPARSRGPCLHGIMRPGETEAEAAERVGVEAPGRRVVLWLPAIPQMKEANNAE